nr:envelope protein [Simian retrovirus 4]
MNFEHKLIWSLMVISQILPIYAGFGDPREALTHIQNKHGKPCECKGGYVNRPPSSHVAAISCGSHTAYQPTNNLKWQCVSTPKTTSGGHMGQCPSACNDKSYDSVHSTCYSSYQQCTIGNKTYFTAIITGERTATIGVSNVPTVIGSGQNLISAGCPKDELGKTACWSATPPVHVSDGGGPQDKVREILVQKKFKELHKNLFPELSYHPLALPKARGKEKIDAQTFDILTAVHNLLNLTRPNLAQDCWLCLQIGNPVPLALPSNYTYENLTSFNCSKNCFCPIVSPFLVQPFNFTESVCLYAPYQNNSYDIDVGLAAFINCSSTHNVSTPLCAPNGSVFACGNNQAYTYLPTNWTGRCVLVTLLPDIDIIPGSEPVPVPAIDHFIGRTKRAVQFIPLLVGLGITTAVSTGAAGLGHSITQYTKLSRQLISDVLAISSTIQDLQDQVDSLAEVVLQNRRGLDLLTAEQGGICLALQEKCCFYTNKSGVVRDKIKRLQDDLEKRRQQLIDNPFWTSFHGLLPYILPLLGPLLCLLLIISFGPLILNKLMAFIKHQIEAIQAKPIQVHYHRLEQEERGGSYLQIT